LDRKIARLFNELPVWYPVKLTRKRYFGLDILQSLTPGKIFSMFYDVMGTLKNSLYSIYFTTKSLLVLILFALSKGSCVLSVPYFPVHKLKYYNLALKKWWKCRDEEMKHTLSKRASLTLKFWMLWNEVCLYQAQSITGVIGLDSFADLQTLEDALTFFGQSFLFTMKLLFCRISFGQMRRQIIDLVIGKRIVSIIFDLCVQRYWKWTQLEITKELIMHWYYKAYLNLTSTYTIHLARDTGMRRHSYKIGIPGEFHINYVLRESHYNECLTTKNSLHCGILDSSSSAWSISTDVSKLHCNHIGTLDAIASPAAPTKTLTVDQLEAFNAAKSALPTPLCYTTPPDSQVHALMVGASDHVIRTVIHGNRWHFGSRPTLRICLPSPLRMSTFRSVHGLSHPGIRITKRLMMEMGPGTLPHLERRTAPAKDRRDLRRSGGGQMLYDNRPSVWVLTSGGGRAYSGKGSLFYPTRDIQYQFSVMPFELCNAPRKF
ncbi:hypothetical protein T08_11695, partial [Trichinella sp. T8]